MKYYSTDSANHFKAAILVEETGLLDFKRKNNNNMNRMFGAMSNQGLGFKTFLPFIGEANLYKIFILYDYLILFLIGMLFFEIILEFTDKYENKLLNLIIMILFVIGYPLNSVLWGFVYFHFELFIMLAISGVLIDKKIKEKNQILILSILNVMTSITYILFCPFVFLSEFIYFIIITKKEKEKLFTKKNFLKLVLVFMPSILVAFFFLIFPYFKILKTNKQIMTEVKTNETKTKFVLRSRRKYI